MKISDEELRLRVARRLAARDTNDRRPDVFDTECVEDERQHYLGMADVAIQEVREADLEPHLITTASTYTPWRYRTLKLVDNGQVVYDPNVQRGRQFATRTLVETGERASYEVTPLEARTQRYLDAMRVAGVLHMEWPGQGTLMRVSLSAEGKVLFRRWTRNHYKG